MWKRRFRARRTTATTSCAWGEALAELLTERGFTVIHDETDHEQNALGTAYERSLKTAQSYVGDVDVFIDLHRDAYSKNGSGNPFCVEIDGVKTARLMFLVGNGKGFDEKPYYAENYGLATRLTHRINEAHEGLCRPVMVRTDGTTRTYPRARCWWRWGTTKTRSNRRWRRALSGRRAEGRASDGGRGLKG